MRKRRWAAILLSICLAFVSSAQAVTPNGSYENGDRGEEIRKLQQALKDLGFLTGEVDGSFGTYTENAVRKFQKKYRLKVDGLVGPATLKMIYEKAEKVQGSSGKTEKTATQSTTAEGTSGSQGTGNAQSTGSTSLFGQYSTLRTGNQGSRVSELQETLGKLGYPCGKDGKYGAQTRSAVKAFQKDNGLNPDGVAGAATLKKLESLLALSQTASVEKTDSDILRLQTRLKELGYYYGSLDGVNGAMTQAAVMAFQTAQGLTADGIAGERTWAKLNAADTGNGGGTTGILSGGSSGDEVTRLQSRLKELGYDVTVNGTYDPRTQTAVRDFQKLNGLTQDSVAGPQTQRKLYSADAVAFTKTEEEIPSPADSTAKASVPGLGEIHLLHWFREIKPALTTGQTILVYEPESRLSWTLKLYSLGRHADCEPLTRTDTETMVKAFGGKNTWTQKAVYVRLPDGTWTLGSTHDTPHLSGSIKDNGFDGHLCVHFLRDMDECRKMDPNYGVSNQETIRAVWKSLTGEVVK